MNPIASPKYIPNALIVFGITLILINFIGYFNYTTVSSKDSRILDDSPQNISEEMFWNNAYRRSNEPLEEYLQRFTELVSERMLLIAGEHTKPTVFENWILWIVSHYNGYYEWSNTERAVRLGGGHCSQHAIIFNNILREQKISSRIVKLGGHVVNEVLVNGEWRVYDSDYNVIFNTSMKDLEDNSIQVYQSYINAGRPEDESKHWQEVFSSDADNWHYKKTRTYNDEKYYIESASFYLLWIIPITLIFFGTAMKKRV